MSQRLYSYSISLLILITISCKNDATHNDSYNHKSSEKVFKQNPIVIAEREIHPLDLGSKAPNFNLPATDGNYYSLDDFDSSSVLVVIFTCNHCPTAQAYESRMIQITDDYKDKSVQIIAISPNSPLGVMYEELGYSDLNDDFDEMIIRAADMGYNFPYLYDGDDHAVSIQYGPAATPHVFVFDKDRVLQYKGRIDASEKPGTGQGEDLRAAIDALLANKKPDVAETKTFGCSTKWSWKSDLKTKVDKEWAQKEVIIKDIDKAGIKNLLANSSDKLRLINIWASWCGPCMIEYPEFIKMHRMFSGRDFEFVSISADKMNKKERALKLMRQKQSAVENYIFSDGDNYALIEAIDPDWNGALPYTMLIEPGGNIVYKYQGEVDFYKLRKTIVEHPMIGRYY